MENKVKEIFCVGSDSGSGSGSDDDSDDDSDSDSDSDSNHDHESIQQSLERWRKIIQYLKH